MLATANKKVASQAFVAGMMPGAACDAPVYGFDKKRIDYFRSIAAEAFGIKGKKRSR